MNVGVPFAAMMAITEDHPGEALDLDEAETHFREMWPDTVQQMGGIPMGGPRTVERIPNMHYGQPLCLPDGSPALDADGQPVRDRVRLTFYGRGYAIRIGAN